MSCRIAALALLLGACAQDVVSADRPDATISSPRDGASGEDARISSGDAASDAGVGNPDAAPGGGRDASPLDLDATLPDVGLPLGNGCNRRIEDDVFVPDPIDVNARFRNVRGLRFGPDRRLYVLSRQGPPYESWVTVLGPAPAHAVIRSFGRERLGAGQDLIIDGAGNIHVVTYDPNEADPAVVHVFDPNGAFLRTWDPSTSGQDEGESLGVDGQGRLYVGGLVVARYEANGTFIDAIGLWGASSGRIGRARGLAYDPRGFLWVADFVNNVVHQYDLASRAHEDEFGGRGTGNGQYDGNEDPGVRWGPTSMDLDAAGAYYANDPFASRIQKISRRGTFLAQFSFGTTMNIGPVRVEPMNGNVYVGLGSSIAIVCPL